MNAPLRPSNIETLQSLAQRAYDKHEGDEAAAFLELIAAINKRASYVTAAVEGYARVLLGSVFRTDRATASRKADAPLPHQYVKAEAFDRAQGRAQAAGQTNRTILMNTVYKHNGKKFKLADATAEMLAPVISHYIGQGTHMLHTGRYLQAVADATPNGKFVRDVHSEADLARLRKTAAA